MSLRPRIGMDIPGGLPDSAELKAIYLRHLEHPALRRQRKAWAGSMRNALGPSFIDSHELFAEHTFLVAVAMLLAHAVLGFRLENDIKQWLNGQLLSAAGLEYPIPEIQLDWPADIPEGRVLVLELARRLAAADLEAMDGDILKTLYEKGIGTGIRKHLGEYYTPDWLAQAMVEEIIGDPLHQTCMDPACGSGTFLFFAVRHLLNAAQQEGWDKRRALLHAVGHVRGMDIHPIALTLARVNILLAIGPKRLQDPDRPCFSPRVFWGDAFGWGDSRLTFQAEDKVDKVNILLGNPPWLAYRYMPQDIQAEFKRMCGEWGLWTEASVAPHQDLSALFVVRTAERFLVPQGDFAYVLPWSVLRGRQHARFRQAEFGAEASTKLTLYYKAAWDLHAVDPPIFPVPSCVVFGKKTEKARSLAQCKLEAWSGTVSSLGGNWGEVQQGLERSAAHVREARDADPQDRSPYQRRFVQGATMVPRYLILVDELGSAPSDSGAGRVLVRSRRSSNEKKPWKDFPSLEGPIERPMVRPLLLGESVLPYRVLPPRKAVVPWDAQKLLDGREKPWKHYPHAERWWRRAETIWEAHRSSGRMSLIERIDYQKGLSNQFPIAPLRVVYTASGMHLAAALVRDSNAVVEHGLYWGIVKTIEEARYLEAILNSELVGIRVRPLQARGQFGPRHFDKYIWQLPIPLFDDKDSLHREISELGESASQLAAGVEIVEGRRFELGRGLIRRAIAVSDTGREIEERVAELFD